MIVDRSTPSPCGGLTSNGRAPVLAVAAILLALAGCNAVATCQAAGGTYVGSTCTRSNPLESQIKAQCESGGGVYLRGQDLCAYGEGGP